MNGINSIIRYGKYLIVAMNPGKKEGKLWSYHIIDLNRVMKNNVQRQTTEAIKNTVSVIIPICNNIKPKKVRHRLVMNAESFVSKIGTDSETGIFGIRFDIINPEADFLISFTTPRMQAVQANMGLIYNKITYKNQQIRSPGCDVVKSLATEISAMSIKS